MFMCGTSVRDVVNICDHRFHMHGYLMSECVENILNQTVLSNMDLYTLTQHTDGMSKLRRGGKGLVVFSQKVLRKG